MKSANLTLASLRSHPDNPRQISDEDFEGLKQSLIDFPEMKEARPIVVSNRTGENVILAGNQRVKALIEIGESQVECLIVENWTIEQEREFIIRDNAHSGDWDDQKLADLWADVELDAWGVPSDVLDKWREVADWDGIDQESERRHPDNSVSGKPEDEWEGMPEYEHKDMTAHRTLIIHFRNDEDVAEFSKLIAQEFTESTKSIWHPKQFKQNLKDESYQSNES